MTNAARAAPCDSRGVLRGMLASAVVAVVGLHRGGTETPPQEQHEVRRIVPHGAPPATRGPSQGFMVYRRVPGR